MLRASVNSASGHLPEAELFLEFLLKGSLPCRNNSHFAIPQKIVCSPNLLAS